MHLAGSYLTSISKGTVGSTLNTTERGQLELCLNGDAKNYYQAAVVSLIDGLRSISVGFFSWSVVKLYYCVFYALRTRLALAGECIFYDSGKPRYLTTSPGFTVKKLSGTTHKCVLDRFSESFPRDFFLSQDIEAMPPLMWLMERREDVNYRIARFTEPISPSYLAFAANNKLRSVLSTYQSDDVYVFDPDHAMVALPFRLMLDLRVRMQRSALNPLLNIEAEFLEGCSRDRAGVIAAISSLLR